mmetsp:Transcript_31946/g.37579  ORF Transcript_31946/g.37579 Transcript_31946/m.37579 type:complete len:91 (+) Transcript_31946:178-450(+)
MQVFVQNCRCVLQVNLLSVDQPLLDEALNEGDLANFLLVEDTALHWKFLIATVPSAFVTSFTLLGKVSLVEESVELVGRSSLAFLGASVR